MASFNAEQITTIGNFPVTNVLLTTLLVDAIIIGFVVYITKQIQKKKKVPGTTQNIIELIMVTFSDLIESVAGKNAPKIFPYVITFFLFILVANWMALIPGLSLLGFHEKIRGETHFIPLFRGITSDINTTLGLALISAFATHMISIQTIGIKEYLTRYFSFNPINLFIGMLEIISEITKVISLSFRLFGNIFAGEVVLAKVSTLFAFVFPVPFLMLEVVVGLVQALVFSMLTMAFMAILATPHHAENHVDK